MHLRCVPLSLTVSFFLVSTALAAGLSPKEIKEKEKAARKACMMGNYTKGSDILSDLFIETGHSNYIFNQARCLQQNHRWQEAVDRFQEFLRKAKNLPSSEASETEKYIAECESHLPKAGPVPEPMPSAPPPPSAPPQPVPVGTEITPAALGPVPETLAATSPVAQPREDQGGGLRIAGIITGALGLVGIGAGVYCSVKTYSLKDDPDRLRTTKTWGIVSYAAGGGLLATGTTLFIIGMGKRGADSSSAVSVSVAPGLNSLFVQGRF